MSGKSQSPNKSGKDEIKVEPGQHAKEDAISAQIALRPTVQAGVTLMEYDRSFGDLDLSCLVNALVEQTESINNGEMGRAEAMLTAQAHTLDAIYNNLARRAINAKHINNLNTCLKLALRAQTQCRATWEAVTKIKNPPVLGYVKQANIAHGHQQINNGPTAAHVDSPRRDSSNLQSKLLEKNNGDRMDTRKTSSSSHVDQAMAALESVDRT